MALVLAATSCTPDLSTVQIVAPTYVWPNDPAFAELLNPTTTPPPVVIVNIENGDGDVSVLDSTADALRRRTAADGQPVKVLGYVWTSVLGQWASRSSADIQASVDRWLGARGGRIHYDGIFFDVTPLVGGPTGDSMEYRDKFLALRRYVQAKLPGAFVVNNPGTAVGACYLEPGKRTADAFVTFEGSERAYNATAETSVDGYWLGGNVSNEGQYVDGHTLIFRDAAGQPYSESIDQSSFWHVVYGATLGQETATVQTTHDRYAGALASTIPGYYDNPYGPVADRAAAQAHLNALIDATRPPVVAEQGAA